MDDETVMAVSFWFLVIGLMALTALRRTKAMALDMRSMRTRIAALEAALAIAKPVLPTEAIAPQEREWEPEPAPELDRPLEPRPVVPSYQAQPETEPQVPISMRLSEWLAGHGLVWVGALALGLSGLFLIRYSIDNGLFGPLARVVAGLGLGAGLIGAGEWLTRRGRSLTAAPDSITSQTALIGSGVCTLFTACYGAYAIYELIDSVTAFILLALIAFAALLMALRHGPVIALIGLVGALTVPLLVSSADPAPFELFLYLAAVIGTSLAVVRLRGWWWLGWVALGGGIGWALAWLGGHYGATDTLVTGGFAFGVLLLIPVGLHLVDTPAETGAEAEGRHRRLGVPPPLQLMLAATAGAMLILFIGLRLENYDTIAMLWAGAAGAFTQWAAWRQRRLIALPWLAAGTALVAYLVWLFPLPKDTGWIGVVEGVPAGHLPGPLIEPAFMPYIIAGFAIAALFGLGGWGGVRRGGGRTWPWSLLSVVVPLGVLIIAYGHTAASSISPPWAVAALILAGLFLAATGTLHQELGRQELGHAFSVAIYAAGVIAAVTLALVMVLHDFWLTVALAVQLPALAWIERRTQVPEMRRIALVMAVTVLVRLVLNPGIADYDIGTMPILNGLLYGYGLPLAAFRAAQLMFRANSTQNNGPAARPDWLEGVLEAGWIGFLVLLVSLQVRHWSGHSTLTGTHYGALEQGLQVMWWGSLALALMYATRTGGSRVLEVAWRLLGAVALGHVWLFAVLTWNPLWRSFPVGSWPGFNLVTLNYGVPAVLAALGACFAGWRQLVTEQKCAGIAAVFLAWLFVTLSVRQAFQGTILAGADPSDPEWYAYSAFWLVYGGGLLALGAWFGVAALRTASMVVIIATVAKVFLFDMSTLTGLLRVASFLGLGLVLVLIGWLHQTTRATFGPKPPAARQSR